MDLKTFIPEKLVVVSTVDLTSPSPYSFETMVFSADEKGKINDFSGLETHKYTSKLEAIAGHESVVEKWSTNVQE